MLRSLIIIIIQNIKIIKFVISNARVKSTYNEKIKPNIDTANEI